MHLQTYYPFCPSHVIFLEAEFYVHVVHVNFVYVRNDRNLMNDVDCDRDHLVGIDHRGNHPLQNQHPLCPDDHVHDDDGVNYDETKKKP